MSDHTANLDTLLEEALRLSYADRARLIERLAATLVEEAPASNTGNTPKRSLRGLLAEYGPAPSAEEIDEVRRDMLTGFPREDIA